MIRKIITKVKNQWHYYNYLQPSQLNATFIISTGRTGTKFFETFFNNIDEQTFAVHEPQPDLFDLSLNKHREGWSKEAASAYIREKRVPYLRSFCASRLKHYVESNPFAAFLLPEMQAVFPKSRFIIITRQPDTYVKSALNKIPNNDETIAPYSAGDKRIRLTAKDFEGDRFSAEWDTYGRIEKFSWYWNKCNMILLDFLDKNPQKTMHIAFEDIFSKDKKQKLESIQRMLRFLDIQLSEQQITSLLELTKNKKNQTQQLVFEGVESWTEDEVNKFNELTEEASKKINQL